MKKVIILSLSLFLIFTVQSCVSVKIGDAQAKKSTRYSFESPVRDFYRTKEDAADAVWISQKTSSTLSIKSKCVKNNDVDLEMWLVELSSGLKDSQIVSSEKIRYNNRRALQAEVTASLEGFENKLALTSFVKNSCQYIILLTSPLNSYDQDLPTYKAFLETFKAW